MKRLKCALRGDLSSYASVVKGTPLVRRTNRPSLVLWCVSSMNYAEFPRAIEIIPTEWCLQQQHVV